MPDLPIHGDSFSFLAMIYRAVSPSASDGEFSGAGELLDVMCFFCSFYPVSEDVGMETASSQNYRYSAGPMPIYEHHTAF